MNAMDSPDRGSSRTRELLGEGTAHPSIEDLAQLLEGVSSSGAAPDSEAPLREHLTRCRRCFGVYAELAETTLTWRWGREADAPIPADWLEEARSMGAPPRTASTRVRSFRRAFRRPGIAVAGVAVVVAVLFVVAGPTFRGRPAEKRPRADAALLAPIEHAVAQASRTGMVLTTEIAPFTPPQRAIGAATRTAELSRSIDELVRLYDQPNAGEDVAYWLVAGMLADGDAGARTILEDSRARFPRSRRLENLEAVIAYRENRLADSERTLARLLDEDPRDPVALFNRLLLLRETGREREAQALEATLLELLPGDAPLRARVASGS